MHVQVCRSVGDWSCGWLTEHSIQDAYLQLIREANHFIYIENQFFVSIPGEAKGPKVNNQICSALAQRIISAAQAGEKFKVMIMIPEVPCFPGDLKASQGTLAILDTQYRSLCRGKESLYGLIEAAGYHPADYVTLFNLRQYDRSELLLYAKSLDRSLTSSFVTCLTYSQVRQRDLERGRKDFRSTLGRGLGCLC